MVDSVAPVRRWGNPAVRAITSAPCAPCHSIPGDGLPVAAGLAGVLAMKKGVAVSFAAVLFATAAHAVDARDVDYLADVMNMHLETQRTGVTEPWLNPSTGNQGNITILTTDDSDSEYPCRTYRLTTEIPGQPTTVVEGSACRVALRLWERTEVAASVGPSRDPEPARLTEPVEPPPEIPPPGRKPDPDIFFASVPTPSDYR